MKKSKKKCKIKTTKTYKEQNMKNAIKKLISATLAAATVFSFTACGNKNNDGGKVDTAKTQIWIRSYTAGYGDEWLTAIEDSFEKKYADVSFEDGKTGVQVHHDGEMFDNITVAQMEQSKYDIFFLQNDSYYALVNEGDGLEDITSTVTDVNVDGKTVLSKLTEQQKDFFGIKDDSGVAHYYGLPHYNGTSGIIYDKDLFDKKDYYIADDQSEGFLIATKDQKKSAGPDGEYKTDDDGLPATYDEFFALMDEIAVDDIPLSWAGSPYYAYYVGHLFDALVADYEGREKMTYNYTFTGTENLVKVNSEGEPVLNADGTPVLEEVAITKNTGYETARQPGKYYAMQFISKLFANSKYYPEESFKTWSQTQAEQAFLQNGKTNTKKNIAMLIDGPWWQREASEIFGFMAEKDEQYSAMNRNLRWMPLPKATAEKVSENSKNVFFDSMSSTVCMKKGTGSRKNACLEFIKYVNSDEALIMFTEKTGALRGYTYDIPDSVIGKLTPFSQSLVKYVKNADVVYRYTSDTFYNKNYDTFKYDAVYNNGKYNNIATAFHEGNYTAETYFKSYYTYFKDKLANIWANA